VRNPGAMHSGNALDNAVLFDLSGEAEELWQRLRADRLVWLEHREGSDSVAVSLRSEPGDLAVVLRAVEAWIAENHLASARFELDGRAYTMAGRPVALSPSGLS
jgi:hypothetical protein